MVINACVSDDKIQVWSMLDRLGVEVKPEMKHFPASNS
jgi:hypothetical protein